MGKKDKAETNAAPPAKAAPADIPVEDEEEDSEVIKQLKVIDDKYCQIEVELEREIEELRRKYDERQAPLIEERKKVLRPDGNDGADATVATPGCPGFWHTALSNASDIEECVHDCDEQVLKYLEDIRTLYIDASKPQKGRRIELEFKENPYFDDKVLWFEAYSDYDAATYKPWKEPECIEVKSCTITWKPGKDITVEKKQSKPTKKKKAGYTMEPIPSFFRIIFQNVKKDDDMPEALECIYGEEAGMGDEEVEGHLDNVMNVAIFMGEQFVKYGIRYYTGEAADEDDDDDDEGEESEEEDDEDDDDDESEDEPPRRGGRGKAMAKKGAAAPAAPAAAGQKQEECKQQ